MTTEEDKELQAKIALLESRIERHKKGEYPVPAHDSESYDYGRAHPNWIPRRGTPYGSPRGRGRGTRHVPFKNRTLVLNANGSQTSQNAINTPQDGYNENTTSSGWVTKRDRHMQLINNSVYEQKKQERTQAMKETRQRKEREREEQEKATLHAHLSALASQHQHTDSSQPVAQSVVIKNIRFIVTAGGSKLVRAKDESTIAQPTPKRATVGGVAFYRSKHGNLYRAGIVQASRKQAGIRKIDELCPQFTSTGSCSKGPTCRYLHDPEKVAICKMFLQTGKCPAGDDCDMSHDPKPERTPTCLHFMRGNCTNPDCRYSHVHVNPGAPVCREFGILGYCSKGSACPEKHVHECPDYTNKGVCHNKKCRLPHVDRAGQLRKSAAGQTTENIADISSDISSEEEYGGGESDDIDSDYLDDEIIEAVDGHELSQQNDFIKI